MAQVRRPVRSLAVLAALGLVGLGSASCGDEAAGSEVVQASNARRKASNADALAGAAIVRHVGTGLYATFATEADDGNLAYSPSSITAALGMTRAGARGVSADQLDRFLGTSDPAELHAALNGLDVLLASRAGTRKNAKDQDSEIELSTANSLWGHEGVEWETPFLETLKGEYGVGVHVVDYEQPDPARKAINAWVAERTHDKIPDLLPDGSIKEITRLTLVNALYLAAPWDEEFDERGKAAFTTAGGDEVQAEMMGETISDRYQDGDGWQSVTIPYAGGELAMTLLVPDAGKLADVEGRLDDELLEGLLTGGEEAAVQLTMPTFDLASRPALGDALKAAGVTEPFETESDFRPMTVDPDAQPLQLADALHMATVTVDEKGTVAAAATAVTFEAVSGTITETELVVDRPFLFVIHDVETATPLFIGRVADPTARLPHRPLTPPPAEPTIR
jgi:serpin B